MRPPSQLLVGWSTCISGKLKCSRPGYLYTVVVAVVVIVVDDVVTVDFVVVDDV